MKRLLETYTLNHDYAALFLRLIIGGFFIHYGFGKIQMWDQLKTMFPDYTGLGSAGSLALLIFAEFGCGLLILLGCFTRFAIVPIAISMAVAFFVAHADDAFKDKQIALLYLLLATVVFLMGSGKYSLDHLIFNRNPKV